MSDDDLDLFSVQDLLDAVGATVDLESVRTVRVASPVYAGLLAVADARGDTAPVCAGRGKTRVFPSPMISVPQHVIVLWVDRRMVPMLLCMTPDVCPYCVVAVA